MDLTVSAPAKSRTPQPLEAINIPDALLRLSTVVAVSGQDGSTIYRKVAAGKFPQPVRFGTRCTRWRAGDVSAWLAEQAKAISA